MANRENIPRKSSDDTVSGAVQKAKFRTQNYAEKRERSRYWQGETQLQPARSVALREKVQHKRCAVVKVQEE